ncbi:MAG: hypothetical protein LAN84_06780 [Acidobacteriia bacterium]|nr:hypothetical protein [Terriglobia bacterium]
MPHRASALLFFLLLANPSAGAQDVRIGVLGLFHPRKITLRTAPGEAVAVRAGEKTFVLEPQARANAAEIRISGDALLLEIGGEVVRTAEIHAASRSHDAAGFILAVPGPAGRDKIRRAYRGTLVVRAAGGVLEPVVTMELETAVASVVQAETAPGTSLEALKAQAVAARSYFIAGRGRHRNFDFCDLTHCQFLREPPPPESPAAIATRATRGLLLAWREAPFAAMFTRSCAGRTRTPAELGMPIRDYPYFAVECEFCRKNPARWSRRVSAEDAAHLLGKGEAGRLAVDRRLGWNAVPSNDFTARTDGGRVLLEGTGQGHGIGLCQRGAQAMAEAGAGFRQILEHYYPNAAIVRAGNATEQ